MHAAVLHGTGQSPRFEEFQEPVPGDGEVLIHVTGASLKSVDKQLAAGTHFASPREFPVVCGIDGVGRLEDGTRVFFGGPRPPFGAMAQRTVVRREQCFSIPKELDDVTAAAAPNPGVSAWLSLEHSAKLARGETVLILGGTGVAGKLAIQIAKKLGAGRVVAAGRNPQTLATLHELGADATIQLERPREELMEAFRREALGNKFDVILDYLWGAPTEALLAALTSREFSHAETETRLIEIGESAGPTISLPAAVLRSTPIKLLGTGGVPSWEMITKAFEQVMNGVASGQLRIETERVPLALIKQAWQRESPGRRLVIIP